jgi:hypothetical protein
MKVIHIIPSAFEYFNDVREQAMNLVEKERGLGVDAEAYTLQYGPVTSKQKGDAREEAPSLSFVSLNSGSALVDDLKNYDLVHLHAPFLGMAGSILRWKRSDNKRPLVITYWRDVRVSDLMSAFLALYNRIYLPKFFSLSDTLIFLGNDAEKNTAAGRRLAKSAKYIYLEDLVIQGQNIANIHLTIPPNTLKLNKVDMEANACVSVYNKLIK